MKLGPENFGHCSPEWEYSAGSYASNTKPAPASSCVQGDHAEEHVFDLVRSWPCDELREPVCVGALNKSRQRHKC